MFAIIDTPQNVGKFASELASAGVRSVLRYYNISNSSRLPSKAITRAELDQLHAAGISVAVAFQQRGGANGHLEDFTAAMGQRDANRSLILASTMAQPDGSAIYFCVDHDYFRRSELDQIVNYFRAVNQVIAGKFRVGVYGSGTVCNRLKSEGLAQLFWVPGSLGWSGTRDFLRSGEWTLFQKHHDLTSEIGSIDYDANDFNPAFSDFGQFGPTSGNQENFVLRNAVAVFETTARDGLNLRGGPSTEYPVLKNYVLGTKVHGLSRVGRWLKVDVNGDGAADGYMSSDYLKALTGGVPLDQRLPATAYDVAQAELQLNIAEVPGPENNPRIVLYHASTSGGGASDETAWCSSFTNYCVEQIGLQGTNSKWARSWHDDGWGQDVTASPKEGDIVVWSRVPDGGNPGGHVAFFVADLGESIRVLGGNQSNRICIRNYPKDGKAGNQKYKLLSIRR
jgi:uncharacterized protein (TIGR02594 family)